MVASINSDAASMERTPLGATNSTATQFRSVDLNCISSGGVISGTLGQSNTGLSAVATLNDVAAASTDIGAATFSTVSQAQMQTLNTLPGGGTSDLNVTQNAATVTIGIENHPNTVPGLGVATISGGVQQMWLPVNVTSLGALGTDSVLQTSTRQAVRLSASVCSNVKPLDDQVSVPLQDPY
jgi:hypothetical protein